jgi:hypothetical protein
VIVTVLALSPAIPATAPIIGGCNDHPLNAVIRRGNTRSDGLRRSRLLLQRMYSKLIWRSSDKWLN